MFTAVEFCLDVGNHDIYIFNDVWPVVCNSVSAANVREYGGVYRCVNWLKYWTVLKTLQDRPIFIAELIMPVRQVLYW